MATDLTATARTIIEERDDAALLDFEQLLRDTKTLPVELMELLATNSWLRKQAANAEMVDDGDTQWWDGAEGSEAMNLLDVLRYRPEFRAELPVPWGELTSFVTDRIPEEVLKQTEAEEA